MFGFLGDIGGAIMTPLYYAVSGILLVWHKIFETVGLSGDSGWTWALSIIGLTITIRTLLIPLFVKQIKSSRNMQLLQPQIKALQQKYKHDRERLTQEQMKLWKETGTNPFASCLPLILQMPIFFALFRVIDQAAKNGAEGARGFLDGADAESLKEAVLLGARIADTFVSSSEIETKIITMSLVVIMCITQFTTQRQLMSKNMPADAMTGQYAQQQKLLLYVLPVVFAVGGVAFPLGVLFYWTTSNFWTMGQQFYVIRNNPAPGTPAFKAKQDRDKKRGKDVAEDPLKPEIEEGPKPAPRAQPKNQPRSQRKKPAQPGNGQQKPNPAKKPQQKPVAKKKPDITAQDPKNTPKKNPTDDPKKGGTS
ncbi:MULTISPECIES: membrane protein insertase YidC [Aeromicrobium]|uniref:membrane protein insertase YidC n=1 Tax=Aeromicrobium TaxID=2040 RepID=UPI00070187D4|nr:MULTISPECIES: membrane protein insertase YidC [Aeromicrobium]KQX74143.1 preprotein translocase YidC [Aeromicrobium sp. Root472D3]MCL8249924.1 membrane protein insertase YidC [Aeromicrobium fastidiosum]